MPVTPDDDDDDATVPDPAVVVLVESTFVKSTPKFCKSVSIFLRDFKCSTQAS